MALISWQHGPLGTSRTIDGGGITSPCLAFDNLKGDWDIEDVGVAPDLEVGDFG